MAPMTRMAPSSYDSSPQRVVPGNHVLWRWSTCCPMSTASCMLFGSGGRWRNWSSPLLTASIQPFNSVLAMSRPVHLKWPTVPYYTGQSYIIRSCPENRITYYIGFGHLKSPAFKASFPYCTEFSSLIVSYLIIPWHLKSILAEILLLIQHRSTASSAWLSHLKVKL